MFTGFFLIADISGYTLYLSKSELDHAEKTLTALLGLLVEQTRPPLIISRLEGDAVISYGLRDNFVSGQTLIEMLENTYVAFRKAIERMVLNTTCSCNACANISILDLKFFFHFGNFAVQNIKDHDELVGSDVILIHRLLKNDILDKFGFRAYTLYTEPAVKQLNINEISAEMESHEENYEDIGVVKVWIQNMLPVWKAKRNLSQVSIPPEEIFQQVEIEIQVPPELVWDYLKTPEFRSTLMGSDRIEVAQRSGGRIAPGSVFQCYHGEDMIPQTILEWQPFERVLIQQVLPIPFPNTTILTEFHLMSSKDGTRLISTDSKPKGPFLGRILVNFMLGWMGKKTIGHIQSFKQQIEADFEAKKNLKGLAAEIES